MTTVWKTTVQMTSDLLTARIAQHCDRADIAIVDARGDVAGTIGADYLAAHAHNVTEAASLALEIEDLGHAAAGCGFDRVVEIQERTPQPGGEQPADRALAGGHEAGQEDVAGHGSWADRRADGLQGRCCAGTILTRSAGRLCW